MSGSPRNRKDRRMSDFRTKGRPSPSRAFRPALDGRLEDRVLLSPRRFTSIWEPRSDCSSTPGKVAFHVNKPPFALNAPRWNRQFRIIPAAAFQTIRGGQAVNVISIDGSHYRIQLSYIPTPSRPPPGMAKVGRTLRHTTAASTSSSPFSSPADRHRPGLCHAERQGRNHRGWLDSQHRADDQPVAAPDSQGLCAQLCVRMRGETQSSTSADHGQQRPDRRHRGIPHRQSLGTAHRHRLDDDRPDRIQLPYPGASISQAALSTRSTSSRASP